MLRRARTPVLAIALALAATLLAPPAGAQEPPADGRGDATVIAVIDSGIAPYHWDFLASKMPQATDADPSNDLPLDQAPDTWLPGFPSTSSFNEYRGLDLTLDGENESRSIASLQSADTATWNTVKTSTPGSVKYYWLPGTKVIGAVTFGAGLKINAGVGTHGQGTTSVSVGNIYGGCPECLLVFIQYGSVASGEQAIEWALSQPWIDGISNSYGFSAAERDRLYSGSDTEAQKVASERGQTVFFSSGNGMSNTFTIPNQTFFSSQEGPDWIVTVGGVHTNGASYTGAGKPADIAGLGTAYPSAYGGSTVTGSGNFSGTSNATPTIAGMYGRALYRARQVLSGSSRTQAAGVVAVADAPFACGDVRPDCELGDGALTASELRTRLFQGAVHTAQGMMPGTINNPTLPPLGEDEYLNEGYGTYFVRKNGVDAWMTEFERIVGPLEGRAAALARPAGEREWMIVDSFCRQELWGDWTGGSFVRGQTVLPGPSPTYPVRTALEQVCPHLFPPL
ncbi:MAG: S8 family serine peptidase [Actinomycetota bacterium]